jgi:glycosyltransferase involved in cell wall biosynthesis
MPLPPHGRAGASDTLLDETAAAAIEALYMMLDDARLSDSDAAAIRAARALLGRLRPEEQVSEEVDSNQFLFFDISDLLGYFPHNRLPTGIQRVQVNTILALLDKAEGWSVGLCCFVERDATWRSVPAGLFRNVCAMSVAGGDATAPGWRAQVASLHTAVEAGPTFVFPHGATLVNLGTSWWVENYFMYLREAKRQSAIRFIPFVHDMIPVLLPDYCIHELVHEFIDWLDGIIEHADGFLANSDATKADLIALAGRLGRTIASDEVGVIPLAADVRSGGGSTADALVARRGLRSGNYVLFVSTVEIRKNHLGAFDAWQRLLALHGREKTPTLVCVGKRGFRSEQIYSRLETSPELRDRVLMLDRVDDEELAALYAHALFTVYPSFYEGWGLPVTESLCHGKVPLIADNSSLPQAGGGFAVPFESGSLGSFVTGLESLIFDASARQRCEERIRRDYRPRTWGEVARDIAARVATLPPPSEDGAAALLAPPGYYPMVRNRALGLDHHRASGELLRSGGGWWRLEDFGCWTRAGGGEVRFRLAAGSTRIALWLAGLSNHVTPVSVTVNGGALRVETVLHGDSRKWIFLDLPAALTSNILAIHIAGTTTVTVVDAASARSREIGVGLCGIYIFDGSSLRPHLDFVEAIALDGLRDHQLQPGALRRHPE